MQKLLLKINDLDKLRLDELAFIEGVLSIYDGKLNLLSRILLYSIESRTIKGKSSDTFILYFNNEYNSIDSIFSSNFSLYDSRNREYNEIEKNSDQFILIGKSSIVNLSLFESHRISSLVESFRLRHRMPAPAEDIN